MSDPQPTFVTEDEFLELPESMERIELVDGEIIVSPAPTFGHQEILRRLMRALGNWAAERSEPLVVGQSPIDVRFGPGRILQPDAFVLFQSIDIDHQGPINQVPELCIEIISRDRLYDRITKRGLYAFAGVQEYWTIHPQALVERWSGPNLMERQEVLGVLTSGLLPGFELSLETLFARNATSRH